jgi:hypothetical protein
MKSAASLVFGALLAASLADSTSYYVLEVRGGSRVYSADRPIQKGRVFLFHRFPDGVYMSLAATEVEKVVALAEPPPPEPLAPGQAVYVGPSLSPGAARALYPAAGPSASAEATFVDPGYGYFDYYWGGGGYVPPPRPPVPPPPSRIGPNGFPILAPPGSPGSTTPPIGANGFPILSPQPPVPHPRRP